jgi:hypothetical protein
VPVVSVAVRSFLPSRLMCAPWSPPSVCARGAFKLPQHLRRLMLSELDAELETSLSSAISLRHSSHSHTHNTARLRLRWAGWHAC